MYEEGIQWEGDDICENEPVTPEMRAIDAFYPGDSAFLESLTGGVTTMCTGFGSGGVVAGTAVIVENNGALVADDMVLVADAGMKCALGENPRDFGRKGKQPNTRASVAFYSANVCKTQLTIRRKKEAAARKRRPL